jgi:hypothetical protein
MTILTESTLVDFLDRFNSFNDAIIRRIDHRYGASGQQQTTLTLSTQDKQSEVGWSNVVIVMDNVAEILFREGASTRQILSDGLTVAWFQGNVWCDLSPYCTDPETMEDFKQSDFYISGQNITWSVESYCEE